MLIVIVKVVIALILVDKLDAVGLILGIGLLLI